MIEVKPCCGEIPVVWRCHHSREFCGCDVEKIECQKCGRVVYGADDDSVEIWNSGGDDGNP